jgi:hypothetical protein
MSQTTLVFRFWADGALVDPSSIVLSDVTGTYGIRIVGGAKVVNDNTPMTKVAVGVYSHTFTDPASGLIYQYAVEAVYAGETHRASGTIDGGTTTSNNLYDLIPRIAAYVGGVPDPVLKQMLRFTLKDFCTETEIWQEDLVSFNSKASEDEYTLVSPYDAYIHRVRDVYVNDVQTSFAEVGLDGTLLTLCSETTEADLPIIVSVTFLPLETCTSVPAWMIMKWGNAIASGTKAYLKAMGKTPWSNSSDAEFWMSQYRWGINQAKREAATRRGPATLRVDARAFV